MIAGRSACSCRRPPLRARARAARRSRWSRSRTATPEGAPVSAVHEFLAFVTHPYSVARARAPTTPGHPVAAAIRFCTRPHGAARGGMCGDPRAARRGRARWPRPVVRDRRAASRARRARVALDRPRHAALALPRRTRPAEGRAVVARRRAGQALPHAHAARHARVTCVRAILRPSEEVGADFANACEPAPAAPTQLPRQCAHAVALGIERTSERPREGPGQLSKMTCGRERRSVRFALPAPAARHLHVRFTQSAPSPQRSTNASSGLQARRVVPATPATGGPTSRPTCRASSNSRSTSPLSPTATGSQWPRHHSRGRAQEDGAHADGLE